MKKLITMGYLIAGMLTVLTTISHQNPGLEPSGRIIPLD